MTVLYFVLRRLKGCIAVVYVILVHRFPPINTEILLILTLTPIPRRCMDTYAKGLNLDNIFL
jgi:hypothetical protein